MQHLSKRQVVLQRWAVTIPLIVLAAVHFFPILYLLSMSLKSASEIFVYPPSLIPEEFAFSNYVEALNVAPLTRFLLNSLVVAAAITLLQIVTSILAAYALARMEFWGKTVMLILFVATMMVPLEVTLVPNYFTIAKLGWINTYMGLIAPSAASGFGIFLLYQFFRTIPKELEEAATVDGASRLRFLFQFMVPLAMPAILGFAVFAFVSAWNQYLWPLVITQSTQMRTAQVGIGMFRAANESNSWGMIMAATTILVLPSMMLFVLTQRQFVRGLTMGGLK